MPFGSDLDIFDALIKTATERGSGSCLPKLSRDRLTVPVGPELL